MQSTSQPDLASNHSPADGAEPREEPLLSLKSAVLKDVQVELRARLGIAKLTLGELLALRPGAVVKLDAPLGGLIELHLNASTVAVGEIVAVGDNFGIRIVEIAPAS